MTGSDVTIYTFSSVPALAAGGCYTFSAAMGPASTNTVTFKIFVDSTQVSTPFTSFSTGYVYVWQSYYCNNSGVQNAQTLNTMYGWYSAYPGSWSALGPGLSSQFGENPHTTPTAVDWSTTHTITVKANAAGGTLQTNWFKIN
jgi:hypothetical protein